ncbi:hypothetical protein X726_17225 [Mesorhizobium sp. L103C105A0]|nr:hypothetical protein X726_17225 [Mesorhizobium sp. L103C105A0]
MPPDSPPSIRRIVIWRNPCNAVRLRAKLRLFKA